MTHSFPTRRSSDLQVAIRQAVEAICANYPPEYWLKCDSEERFPEEFYADMVAGGYVGLTFPEECGGAGLGIAGAAVVVQAIVESGAGLTRAATVQDRESTSLNSRYSSAPPMSAFALKKTNNAKLR